MTRITLPQDHRSKKGHLGIKKKNPQKSGGRGKGKTFQAGTEEGKNTSRWEGTRNKNCKKPYWTRGKSWKGGDQNARGGIGRSKN